MLVMLVMLLVTGSIHDMDMDDVDVDLDADLVVDLDLDAGLEMLRGDVNGKDDV